MAIESGRMRHRIKVLRVTNQRSRSGELSGNSYELITPAWADILTSKRAAQVMSNGDEMPFEKVFHTRFIRNLDDEKSLAIEFQGRRYKVTKLEDPEHKHLELYFGTEHIR